MAKDTLAPMVAKLQQRGCLDDQAQRALLSLPHRIRKVQARHYVVREGDRTTHCALLLSGFVYRHKLVGTGARQIVSIHMKGDLVDLQNSFLNVADHNVQALTQAELALIPREAVVDLALTIGQIGLALWIDTLADAATFREWIVNVGRRDARARTAHFLCEFAIRLRAAGLCAEDSYELPMTQEQLADVLGLTPIHINRTLKALQEEGLIIRDKRAVRIADWDRLAEAGGFSADYLHLERQTVTNWHSEHPRPAMMPAD